MKLPPSRDKRRVEAALLLLMLGIALGDVESPAPARAIQTVEFPAEWQRTGQRPALPFERPTHEGLQFGEPFIFNHYPCVAKQPGDRC